MDKDLLEERIDIDPDIEKEISQLQEAKLNAFLSSQLSKFRHRVNNPDQYTGIEYDPEGKLKVQEEDTTDKQDVIFFSSQIVAC